MCQFPPMVLSRSHSPPMRLSPPSSGPSSAPISLSLAASSIKWGKTLNEQIKLGLRRVEAYDKYVLKKAPAQILPPPPLYTPKPIMDPKFEDKMQGIVLYSLQMTSDELTPEFITGANTQVCPNLRRTSTSVH